ncbi:tail spike protein [Acinetobacter phage Herod]|nr:tail spike protein [Acinetobacter phage Herod]
MADVLVTGIKIGDMPLKGTVSGNEKLPTGDVGDLAVTPNQIKDFTIAEGNLVSQEQLDDAVESLEQTSSGIAGRVQTLEDRTSNVNNTADLDKPVSNATQAALNEKADKVDVDAKLDLKADKDKVVSSFNGQVGEVILNQSDLVELGEDFSTTPIFQDVPKLTNPDGSSIPEFDSQIQPLVNSLAVHRQGLTPTFDQDFANKIGGYPLNARLMLDNGDIVQSTIANNVNNPNVDMAGWVKTNSASQIFDESGLSQQAINDSSKRLNSNVLDYFTKSELESWKSDPNTFDASDAIIRAQTLSSGAEINFPSGVFRITKKIPSTKSWRGVRGGYAKRGTHIIVDNPVAIDGVIDCSMAHMAVELHDIQFEDKQRLLHTLLIEGVYQGFYSGIRVDRFKLGIQTSGTYIYFEKCYFVANGVGIRPTPTDAVADAQSTMFGCRECFFIYNDIGYDISGVSAADDLINVPFISCGFELNRIGLNSPNRTWYLTLLNCWFEANSDYGLYAPTSHLIEINTRHNANSPFVVSPTESTKIFGMTASFVDLEIKGDIKFPAEYSSTGAAAKGKTISQTFTDDGGGVVAEIAFVREQNSNIYGGSGIEFSTAISTTSPDLIPRWGVNQFGVLYPKQDVLYNIGAPTKRCKAVFTASIMYTETCGDFAGSGSPEGVVVATKGSTYRRVDGGSPSFYVKESDVGSSGWVAK